MAAGNAAQSYDWVRNGAAVAIALLFASALWISTLPPSNLSADASDPGLVNLGRQTYAKNCASCHGADLEGQPNWRERGADGFLPAPPHDEGGHTWHHGDNILFDLTKRGPAVVVGNGYISAMPGFSEILSDREIWSSLAYIKSRWPLGIRAAQANANH